MARDNGSQLVWFTAGAAIGATIALLYAPQTGKETRRYLGKKTRYGREVLAEAGGDSPKRQGIVRKRTPHGRRGRRLVRARPPHHRRIRRILYDDSCRNRAALCLHE